MKRFPPASPPCYVFSGLRTPFGKVGGALSRYRAPYLGLELIKGYFQAIDANPEIFDGLVVGEIYTTPTHPSSARYIAVESGFRKDSWAVNISNNCASGFEAIIEAARQIMLGEADLVVVLGEESTTNFPIWLEGVRQQPHLSTIFKLMQNVKRFDDLNAHNVEMIDASNSMFIDPNIGANIAVTAEILSQNFNLRRTDIDEYAHQSYIKAIESWKSGRISPYIFKNPEYPDQDENLLQFENIERLTSAISRAPTLLGKSEIDIQDFFDRYGCYLNAPSREDKILSTTRMNCAPKSDGAGLTVLASERGQQILATQTKMLGEPLMLRSWSRLGVSPEYMGLGMGTSALQACERVGLQIDDICQFEFHEAFASTIFGVASLIQEKTGFDLQALIGGDRVNPNGGSLAIGHALGAAGLQLLLNSQQAMAERPNAKRVLTSICAGGGVSASIILERC